MGGGSGAPSATRNFSSEDAAWGIGGGNGAPSARRAPSIQAALLVELLTEEIAGITIRRVKAESAKTNAVFFKAVALLAGHREEAHSGRTFQRENVPFAEQRGAMRALTQLQQNRRVIQDFTLTTLAGIPGQFARLVYVASLRDLSSGRYEHQGLAALYPGEAVQQALELCHEQIFERILETPLSEQLEDLRGCLAAMEGGLGSAVSHWRQLESYRVLLPEQAPDYLKELFLSNLRALLEILQEECTSVRSDA